MARRRSTVHEDGSAPATLEQRAELARLQLARALPATGDCTTTASYMLASMRAIVAGEPGTRFEAAKLIEWAKRFPTKEEAAPVEAWQDWPAETRTAVADRVLIEGWSPARAALRYHTTPETVAALVAAEKLARRHG